MRAPSEESGPFHLDVDPDGVLLAAHRLVSLGHGMQEEGTKLRALDAALDQAWEGKAATALGNELTHLSEQVGRSAPFLIGAGRSLTELSHEYQHALDVELPRLNRQWAQADADHQAALGRIGLALSSGGMRTETAPSRQSGGPVITFAPDTRLQEAEAALSQARHALQRRFEQLVQDLRDRTRHAAQGLAHEVVGDASPQAVQQYRAGGAARDALLSLRSTAFDAFSKQLPLTALEHDLTKDPGWDVDRLGRELDAARRAGLSPWIFRNLLKRYWQARAIGSANIDPYTWDPAKGVGANLQTVCRVYDYYGQLYLQHPQLQWAGMANLIGPSFAAGFVDLGVFRGAASKLAEFPLAIPGPMSGMSAVATMGAGEFAFYEQTFLGMQRKIFLDQAAMHEAYLQGGLGAIEEMKATRVLDPETANAWGLIASDDPDRVARGNNTLLRREQFAIIADDYDLMRARPVTGDAMTYLMTWIGDPSIPGARSFPEFRPLNVHPPRNLYPPTWPLSAIVPPLHPPAWPPLSLDTPLPDGNISNRYTRWDLVSQDTLPAYQRLLREDPDQVRELVGTPARDRVAYQLAVQFPQVIERLDDFHVKVNFK